MPSAALPLMEAPSCCAAPAASSVCSTKFHFSLNVRNLQQSVEFYQVLFAMTPAKHHSDYAKFELIHPPLVFSLVPHSPASAGALTHFGLPVSTTEEVAAAGQRLQAAGLTITCQEGTVCGYARQDKVWVADPDHNHWEIYVIHEDVNPESIRSGYDGISPAAVLARTLTAEQATPAVPERVIWEHRVMQDAPERIPYGDATVDEVRLEGTFNSALHQQQRTRLLREAMRVLKPGGEAQVHGLVSDRPLSALPELPGVAALVRQVPVMADVLTELRHAGFTDVLITKLSPSPVFHCDAAELREIKVAAKKLVAEAVSAETRKVLYKGPFARITDDAGQVFERGQRTSVSSQTWERLSQSTAARQFLFIGCQQRDESSCSSA